MAIWYVVRNGNAAPKQFGYVGAVSSGEQGEEQLDDASNAEIQAWLAAAAVPARISSIQLMRWLNSAGKLDQANAIVAQADSLTKALWSAAAYFERSDATLIQMATALGMSSSDLDAAFIAAAKL